MDNKNASVIYILTNSSFKEYVKIGYADDVVDRVKHLNGTECTPFGFRIYATYESPVRLTDMKLHSIIERLNSELRSIEKEEEKLSEEYSKDEHIEYSEEYHLEDASDQLRDLYGCLKEEIRKLADFEIFSDKIYILLSR